MPPIIALLGPPGSGKGNQAERLKDRLGFVPLATGDLLRAAREAGTDLGRRASEYMDRGDLVPDEVMVGLIAERVASDESADGFILDGFPRTITQGEALDAKLSELGRGLTAAILMDVPDEEVIRRLSGRRVCVKEGHIFHMEFDPPKNEGVCDICGSRLEIRDDDKPEVVRNRLATYHEKTEPLVAYYEERALLRRVDGMAPPDEVSDRIRAMLATLRMEEEL
jgi:adenylate kinase